MKFTITILIFVIALSHYSLGSSSKDGNDISRFFKRSKRTLNDIDLREYESDVDTSAGSSKRLPRQAEKVIQQEAKEMRKIMQGRRLVNSKKTTSTQMNQIIHDFENFGIDSSSSSMTHQGNSHFSMEPISEDESYRQQFENFGEQVTRKEKRRSNKGT